MTWKTTVDNAFEFLLRFLDLSVTKKEEATKVIPSYGEMKSLLDIAATEATAT
jgi:hypothetical protein